ncbi:MAG: carbamoyltransferase HypF [Phycisphaerae bacterium]|nr:carbamoyltransferase HypF [Phycisphaerae bacterium]
MSSDGATIRRQFRVIGLVQGVGFRPFVHRLAEALCLVGFVRNDSRGVTIEAQGSGDRVAEFVRRLRAELPAAATISRLDEHDIPPRADEAAFVIAPSADGELADAQVAADSAVCDDCLRELRDPADRRFRYPFLNCTRCGPRYTIVRRIPYDRPNTTMSDFAMCPPCRREYDDPADRRFHAQPIACPACGPKLWLADSRGQAIECDDAVAQAAKWLLDGNVLAVKGLGGFHLCCRADADTVVRALRRRKRRDAKPLAVMLADLDVAKTYCDVNDEAAAMLTSPARPIVILPTRGPAAVAPSVTNGLGTLGVMLPHTPLHHLLFDSPGLHDIPLVMTSGNLSDEPLAKDNDEAVTQLGNIADFLLLHDRPIERRLDDSVVQLHLDGATTPLRRARGYAPQPIELSGDAETSAPRSTGVPPVSRMGVSPMQRQPVDQTSISQPNTNETATPCDQHGRDARGTHGQDARATDSAPASVLAFGPELKNTICLLRGPRAVMSEHIGDLKDGRVYRHYLDTIGHLLALHDATPTRLAADLHPQYLSTQYAARWARGELAGREAVPLVRVQHHHAHIASCLAEHGLRGPVIGLACDGAGWGDDGAVWGCEVLRADVASYRRLGHLRYVPLPGGDAASREPARPALAALWDTFGTEIYDMPTALRLAGGESDLERFVQILSAGANCPPAGSLGRWFDAVAALTGLARENAFEGQAAMMLEAAAVAGVENAYAFRLLPPTSGEYLYLSQVGTLLNRDAHVTFEIDLRPMVAELCNDVSAGFNAGVVSARFHNTVAAFLLASAKRAREQTGLGVVALSGGCFANRYLTRRLTALLEKARFTVLRHRTVPCNDGGVSLGQAVVAAAGGG